MKWLFIGLVIFLPIAYLWSVSTKCLPYRLDNPFTVLMLTMSQPEIEIEHGILFSIVRNSSDGSFINILMAVPGTNKTCMLK